MAVAVPVNRWEPRVALRKVTIAGSDVSGRLKLKLDCVWMPRALFGDYTPVAQPSSLVPT
jgi:phage baseplate assembly protein W